MDYYNHFCHLLSDIDEGLLLAVNGYHTQFLDEAMWTISDRWTWVPMYFLLLLTVVRKTGFKKGAFVILFVTALIIATDQTCASFIRPLVVRLRPSNPDNPVSELIITVNGYRGGRYGFPSCHAANTFALAIYLSLLLKNRYVTISMVTWSLLVSFSRIYLGVHYPGDILGGMAVGTPLACIYYQPLRWYDRIVPHETPQLYNHSMPAVRKRFRLISSIKALAIGIIILKPAAGIAQSDTIDCHAIPTERTEPYKFKPLFHPTGEPIFGINSSNLNC